MHFTPFFYKRSVAPTPFKSRPKLVACSADVLRDLLDLDPESVTASADFLDWVAGNSVLPGTTPLAHRYGGHQVHISCTGYFIIK
jgi:uncharacterized protein YdiU (UPF0061 family)